MPSIATTALPPMLQELFTSGQMQDRDGKTVRLYHEIKIENAVALYQMVKERRPKLVVEIGMAMGLSSLAILHGLRDGGGDGRLISIDPGQTSTYKNMGRLNVERSGLAERHELIEDFDYLALPKLLGAGRTVDLGYIDGLHTFDYVMLDFFYLDKMVAPGGVIGFNDCGWRSAFRAMKFLKHHRRYRELDAGLPLDYRGSSFLATCYRRVVGQSNFDRYFQKVESWEPPSYFYARF